jgi:hypothetical protein
MKTAGTMGLMPLPSFASGSIKPQSGKNAVEYLEFIKFTLHVGQKKNLVRDFYKDAAIPALNRCGLDRIGVFNIKHGPNDPSLIVLIPHPTFSSVLETPSKLIEDKQYLDAGAEFLNKPLSDAAYVRMQKSLLVAFKNMPKVEAPIDLLGKSRIFQLRIYESHSQLYAKRKIDMFNEGGEIALFRKTGLQPVFFGETVFGPKMPNLTYMLAFESISAKDNAWSAFSNHPEWDKLKAKSEYKDTVSNITDLILRPESCSQI